MALRAYLDANALIRAVEADDPVAMGVRSLLATRHAAPVSSELTLAEVLVVPLRRAQADPSDPMARVWRSTYEALFRKAGTIDAVPVSAELLLRAAELRAEHRSLRLPDAIHLATCLSARCDVIITQDGGLLRAASAYLPTCSLIESELTALFEKAVTRP
ncbi:type II toxin-antitoxin system VapC family toxin [Methylopila sp. Yamaguchi]|uniref:type II toxin-antitoxin system VapC family toxin n=1 Tax=Methylopila sp. Yamaguchi TaxID=1437817 RepID=UPI000CC4E87E|nr:PIN domain-containing protein [Methylopila sp. Yamaguchi]GBD49966.1 twitching mobility protein PilT [Methylopila sp. Yamaguchi]